MSKIPATIVTGFLGAGKTTLVRQLLMNAGGRRIAVIVNEFGELGIDGEVLRACGIEGCDDEDIVELSNGCLCCTVAEDFIPTMQALLDRPNPPEHIVIETSGLALPKPLLKAFNWPGISSRVTVDGVIALVDAPAVAAGRFADDPAEVARQRAADPSLDHDNPLAEVFEDQLGAADLVVLNKANLLSESELHR
ncbi:MAG: cobalamin biosynthesis protein CobW, partial [Pseudomonadota bacterium]|nr:cobalamin biosynthesis protein CobW [Pseudomonadota bacterium]